MDTTKKDTLQTFHKKAGKKKKIFIIIGVIVIVLFAFISNMRKQAAAMEETITAMQQTEIASKRSLVKSIGATGTIVSIDAKDISVSLTGAKVETVAVSIGDTVTEGALLLSFDTTDIEENLETAKNNLSKAQTKNNLSESDAQRNYDTKVESAKEALDDAEDYRFRINDYLAVLKSELSQLTDEAAITAKKAEISRYEAMAEAAEEAYQAQLKNYKNTLASAESSLSSTLLNLDTSTQKSQVELYEEQLEKAVVYAPISGVVTALNYEEGDTYNGGTIVTIQDCSSFEVEAQISEYDISDVALGQKVLIKTNATGEEEMNGTITFISPTATTSAVGMSGSDVTYKVRISIDNPSDRLRLDMSASLSIILEKHDNVLTVPYNAVQTREDGSTFVSVKKEDGSFYEAAVTVVMESNYYTEITSNELTEGMEVLIIDSGSNSFMDLLGGGRRGGF